MANRPRGSNAYKTSGGVAIGTTPLTGTPLSLYGGGGNLDATILRIEGKNQANEWQWWNSKL